MHPFLRIIASLEKYYRKGFLLTSKVFPNINPDLLKEGVYRAWCLDDGVKYLDNYLAIKWVKPQTHIISLEKTYGGKYKTSIQRVILRRPPNQISLRDLAGWARQPNDLRYERIGGLEEVLGE